MQFFSVILACRLEFEPQSFHVGFVVDTVRGSHVILQIFGFPRIINILPMSHARPSWYSSQKDKWAKPENLLTGRGYLRKKLISLWFSRLDTSPSDCCFWGFSAPEVLTVTVRLWICTSNWLPSALAEENELKCSLLFLTKFRLEICNYGSRNWCLWIRLSWNRSYRNNQQDATV
jgi:hypothetical protein